MAQLVEFIKRENRGTSEELATRMQISRRTLFRYLDELRSLGAEIEFCKCKNTYILKNEFNFFESFFTSAL